MRVKPCDMVIAPELEGWLAVVRRSLVGVATSARSRALASHRGNMSRLTRFCLRFFQTLDSVAVQNDKEPGFTLVSRPALARIHKTFLHSSDYKPIPRNLLDAASWGPEYAHICRSIADFEEAPSLFSSMMKSAKDSNRSPSAFLMINSRTHKDELAWRNLHTAGGHAFAGLYIWLCKIWTPLVENLPHILKSREQFVSWARSFRLRDGDYMIRIDIKHYFMSGTADDIGSLASQIIPDGPRRRVYENALMWVLTNQFITSKAIDDPDMVFQVTRGSGMGLQPSGPVTDAAFYSLAEENWACCPTVAQAYGIRAYVRFKDDIFVVASDRKLTRTWYQQLVKRSSRVFQLHVEEVSDAFVTMLSLEVRIQGHHFRVRPSPPSGATPLSYDSAHHPALTTPLSPLFALFSNFTLLIIRLAL